MSDHEVRADDDPPKKRWRFQLTADTHDGDHLARLLRSIANDADRDDIPAHRTSGDGYWFDMTEVEPTMTRERYEGELMSWWNRRREARRPRGADR